jgi:MSHA biogenesis protein MshN
MATHPEVPVVAVSTTPRSDTAAPVRLDRQLSQEQLDRNNSQSAMALLQGGRLFEAYEQLLTFISQNPSAHQSRETLATLLLAQQEFVQARQIIDEGLTLVPNYAPFKKIKARLLLQGGDSAQALELLRSVPPQLNEDPEYHELLASLYQQSGNHPGAVAAYQDLLRSNSQQGRWWVGLAISLEAQGNVTDAMASYQAAQQTSNLDSGLRQYSQGRIQYLGAPR